MKDSFYFSHDYNPTADPKMQALIGEYGAAGYGLYWRFVEMLHNEESHKLPKKKYLFMAVAKQMLTSVEQVEVFVNDCIKMFELFKADRNNFWCERVFKNIEKRNGISEARSKAGKISAEKRKNSTHVEQPLTHVEHKLTKPNKEKERKEKESKLNNINIIEGQNFSNLTTKPENKIIDFKKNTEQSFIDEAKKINLESQILPDKDLEHFINYWTESDTKGKMKYQFQKTWDLKKRLITWKLKSEQFNKGKPKDITENKSFKLTKDSYGN